VLPADGLVTMPFTLFAPCIDNAQGVEEATAPAAVIAVDGRRVRLSSGDGLPLGDLVIMDAMGRTIRTVREGGGIVTIDLGHVPPGTYLVRQQGRGRPASTQRFIIF
jgi:hypothetical protein